MEVLPLLLTVALEETHTTNSHIMERYIKSLQQVVEVVYQVMVVVLEVILIRLELITTVVLQILVQQEIMS